jgi:MinD-like ATPase involved in chromosome partitioning or flagellar assembly
LNPPARGLDAIPILLETGWGVVQLPADTYPREVAAMLLEQVAEQAEEFHRHGYDVVVIGRRAGLQKALAKVGLRDVDAIEPVSARGLRSFLRRRASRAYLGTS